MAALAAIGIAAPFVNAARFSASVQQALEESLGRKVSFDKVYYRVFPVPGFSLERVTISEDPRFGAEPFSYMNGLEARLRIDKLLVGEVRFASLRLIDPSLNLVKRDDGAWNVEPLMERLSAPRRLPLNLIPAIQVSNGRLDFKLGTRKTIFYVTGTDLAIYPEGSGRVTVNFEGSPARTDRAGNGFGSMRGSVKWMVNPPTPGSGEMDADLTLEPSNLGELTALIEGHDVGVHGRLGSHAVIRGPLAALQVQGSLRLQDVHRWDLLPSTGDDWRVPYEGTIDLTTHSLDLHTLGARTGGEIAPAAVQVRANDFFSKPSWTVITALHKAPVESLLPLARRMGFAGPADLDLTGTIDGSIGYSNISGLNGEVAIHDAIAKLPGITPLSAASANVKILANAIHLEPATLQTVGGGTLQAGGDYSWLPKQHLAASIEVNEMPLATLKNTAQAWFGTPPALTAFSDGSVTGELQYDTDWSGQFQFSNATINLMGVANPLKKAQGRVVFDAANFDLAHFAAMVGQQAIQGSYHYNQTAKRPERLHLELAMADLNQIVAALEPTWREPGLLARLPFTKRSIPAWMAARNLEGDVSVAHFSVDQTVLGSLNARFVWSGANVEVSGARIRLAEGDLQSSGTVNLSTRTPRLHFAGKLSGYHWGGGLVDAEGDLESTDGGTESFRDLQATGSFSGGGVSLSPSDNFEKMSGTFDLTFAGDWPKLHLTKVKAVQRSDDWNGEAISNSDGQLIFDLGNGERRLHIVSALVPAAATAQQAAASTTVTH